NDFMLMVPSIIVAERSYSLGKMGKREEAEAGLRTLDERSKHDFVDPFFMATVYLGLDDKDRAIAWLEKAYEAKSSLVPSLVNDAKWDELRNEERFHSLLTRTGFLQ